LHPGKEVDQEGKPGQTNLLVGMHMQIINEQKALDKSGFQSNAHVIGSTAHKGSTRDKYILSRHLNCPELVFNQNPELDINQKTRFFEMDHT